MALPTTGQLKFSQILTEFGDTPPKQLSDYYGLAGLPSSGQLKISNFRGVSAQPPQTFAWLGLLRIKPGRIAAEKTGSTYQYGYRTDKDFDNTVRTPVGTLLAAENYANSDWHSHMRHDGEAASWVVFGSPGLLIGEFTPSNTAGYDARDVDRVEYSLYNQSGGLVGSGLMATLLIDDGDTVKYGTRYHLNVIGGSTGALSNRTRYVDVLKYCYDNNLTIEMRTIVL